MHMHGHIDAEPGTTRRTMYFDRFTTAIDRCIVCQSACTCGDSFLLFYHRHLCSWSQMMALPVLRL